MGVIFLLSGKVFVGLSQSCLLLNQPDSDLRLIPKGQYQLIWDTARNCPGLMVGADLCIGRAFIDLEKFWGVQVKRGTLSSHWDALPTDTCTRMLCSYRGGEAECLLVSRSFQRESDLLHQENEESADLLPHLCTVETQLTEGDVETDFEPSIALVAMEMEGNGRWRFEISVPFELIGKNTTYVN